MSCKKSAYISLVRSILDYSAIIWDPYYIQDINKLEGIQKQATRFITGDYKLREEGCVTKMIHDLGLDSLDYRNDAVSIVFSNFDFAKAFGKVPHRRLLHKLDYYGIRGSTHKWIYSWLSGRTQQVVLDG